MNNKQKYGKFLDYTSSNHKDFCSNLKQTLDQANRLLSGAVHLMMLARRSGSSQVFEYSLRERNKANECEREVSHILDRIEDACNYDDAYRSERNSGVGRPPKGDTAAIRRAVDHVLGRNPTLSGEELRDKVWSRLDDKGYGEISNAKIQRVIREMKKVPFV